MIGVSLPFDWIATGKTSTGELAPLLAKLKAWGVESIELRTVRPAYEQDTVLRAMELLWSEGFYVTVHGSFTSAEEAVDQIFKPLEKALAALKQKSLNITVHPIKENLEEALIALSDHILKMKYPVTVSLENNRLLPGKEEGDCAGLVIDTVEKLNRDNIGICFDFGHYGYYVKKNRPEEPDLTPSDKFCRRVFHTHIHALKDFRTHYPLENHPLNLELYLKSFSDYYQGIYNLELDFPRIAEEYSPEEALAASLPYLKEHLPQRAKVLDRVRKELDGAYLSAISSTKDVKRGTVFSLIHSTSYLFGTDGYFWGMDIAFRHGHTLAKTPKRSAELLKDLKLLVITHEHRDHYEAELLKMLASNETQFVVPDFLLEEVIKLGISKTKITVAKDREELKIGPLTILPFESRHFRPDGRGVKEYGYHVSAESTPAMLFPGDIRSFDLATRPAAPDAEVLFAHLWLGDDSATQSEWKSYLKPWAKFMLSFSPRKIFITHLYENARPESKMWRKEHVTEAKRALESLSTDVEILIPDWGESFNL